MADEQKSIEQEHIDRLQCFVLNHPYEFIEALQRMTEQQIADALGFEPPADTDVSYRIKQYMALIKVEREIKI